MKLEEHFHLVASSREKPRRKGGDVSMKSDDRSLFSIGSFRSRKKGNKRKSNTSNKKKKKNKSSKKERRQDEGHGNGSTSKRSRVSENNPKQERASTTASRPSSTSATSTGTSSYSKLKLLRDVLFREKNRKIAKKRDLILKTSSSSSSVSSSSSPGAAAINPERRPSSYSETSDSELSHTTESSPIIASMQEVHNVPTTREGEALELMSWRREHSQKRESTLKRIEKIDQALRDHEEKIRSSMRTLLVVDENEALNASLDDHLSISTSNTTELDTVHDASSFASALLEEQSDQEAVKFVSNLTWTIPSSLERGLYSGPSLNGEVPHGRGIAHFSDGSVYNGFFKHGEMDGVEGSWKSASGDHYYIGDFRCSQRHGHGEEVYKSGSRYIGNYENGARHGFGVLYRQDGSVFHLGRWQRGRPLLRQSSSSKLLSPVSDCSEGSSTRASDSSVSTDESNAGTSIYEDAEDRNQRCLPPRVPSTRSLGGTLDAYIAADLPRRSSAADDLSMSTSSSNSNDVSIYDSRYFEVRH